MPRGLDRMYARILRRIQQHPKALRDLARKCLVWVFYAARPLNIKGTARSYSNRRAFSVKEGFPRYDEEALIEACANLIEVNYGFVRPIHYSVQEYFTTRPESIIHEDPGKILVNSTVAHVMLSHFCLSYLLQGFLDAGPSEDSAHLYFRVQRHRLASYSSYYFISHLRQLSEVPTELKKLLKRLLSSSTTAFASLMQLRALCGRVGSPSVIATQIITLHEVDASTVIYSTSLLDHPDLHKDIKGFLTSVPKYVIHQAASAGLLDSVTKLMQEGNQFNERDHQGKTPLYYASRNGHREICYYLLKHGANIEEKGRDGKTVLHAAAFGGHEAVVRLLLEDYKADAEAKDDDGKTVPHVAAFGGNEAVVRLLLDDYKADAEAKYKNGKTVLHAAAFGGHEVVVRLLLDDYKADAEAKDKNGLTVLHVAAFGGNEAVVRLLLEDYKVDIDAEDEGGRTALHYAVNAEHETVVQLLEAYKADVKAKASDN
jgi:ankyrin repeat protein